ncbi:MAG: HAD family hydrolase [Betaproteobacteria bacterium]|nr:HAD family hydrolase [Betaproteobacteria bacterium]
MVSNGDTVVLLADETSCLALFRIGGEVRQESAAGISSFRAAGKRIILLTGDAPAVAYHRVANKLGISMAAGWCNPARQARLCYRAAGGKVRWCPCSEMASPTHLC